MIPWIKMITRKLTRSLGIEDKRNRSPGISTTLRVKDGSICSKQEERKTRTAEQGLRLAFEYNLFKKYFSSFRIYKLKGDTYIEGWIRTNDKSRFRLRIPVPEDYPYSKPKLYVTKPVTLYQFDRKSTINALGCCYRFRTLPNGPKGLVCICHTVRWDPSRNFLQILKKGVLWCEAYKMHLQTGQDINKILAKKLILK